MNTNLKPLSGEELYRLLGSKANLSEEAQFLLGELEDNRDNLSIFDESYHTDGHALYVEQDEYEHPNAIEGDYDSTRFTGKRNINWIMDL